MSKLVGYLVHIDTPKYVNFCIMDAELSQKYEVLGKDQLREVLVERLFDDIKKKMSVHWEKSDQVILDLSGLQK